MSRVRIATIGLGWLVTVAVILVGTTRMHITGARAGGADAAGVDVWHRPVRGGGLIATRYRHQWLGLAFGGPAILLIGLALAQR